MKFVRRCDIGSRKTYPGAFARWRSKSECQLIVNGITLLKTRLNILFRRLQLIITVLSLKYF